MNAYRDDGGAEYQPHDEEGIDDVLSPGCWLLTVVSLSAIVVVAVGFAVWKLA